MRMMGANIWMYGVLGAASVGLLALFVPWLAYAMLTGRSPRDAARRGIWRYGRVCAWASGPAVRIVVNNPEALCGIPGAVVVANHQSALDPYLLGAQDADNVGMLAKGWPFRKLFFFSPLMRMAGYIDTERGGAEATLAACRALLADGGHVLGFPEGTRSPDGGLGRFRSGLFALAVETGVMVVPMVIHDSRSVLPKGGRLFRPGTIHIEYLAPVDATAFADAPIPHGALRRHVRALMAARLAEHRAASTAKAVAAPEAECA